MWTSTDDIVKDLATLNDCNTPEDLERYKLIFSKGRASKMKKKKETPVKLIVPRNGEVIDADNTPLSLDDCYYITKGRGRLLCGYSSTSPSIQDQLRLARPMGSGDEAFESYCRRKRSGEDSSNTSDSESFVDTKRLTNTEKTRNKPRIKASQNSNLQSNALIDNLLSKAKDNLCDSSIIQENSTSSTENNDILIKESSSSSSFSYNEAVRNSNSNSGSTRKKAGTNSKPETSDFVLKDEDFPLLTKTKH